jgi:hypothetical protein
VKEREELAGIVDRVPSVIISALFDSGLDFEKLRWVIGDNGEKKMILIILE